MSQADIEPQPLRDRPSPDSPKPNEESNPPRSIAEWTTFGIASLILAGIVGLVVYLWLGKEHQRPPEIAVSRGTETREAAGQFYVPFTVKNTGGGTAEAVQVMAELKINGSVEAGEQQIDFLSGGETEEGAFVFSHNPQEGELVLRVASYKLP